MLTKKAYVKHPVKKALNKEGFKVVDIKFKPEKLGKDDKVVEKPKPGTKK